MTDDHATVGPATLDPATTPIAVIGPTATGKSDLALDLAEKFDGEIVNVDAMQQYRGMDIGTAKLSVEERRGIPHHQLDVLEVTEIATVARYQSAAVADVDRFKEETDAGTRIFLRQLIEMHASNLTVECENMRLVGELCNTLDTTVSPAASIRNGEVV